MPGGIYTITAPSGHQYVGSTVSFASRWTSHRSKLRKGRHPNKALSSAFRKYGEVGLVYRRILVCEPTMLAFYEQLAIDALKPKYNSRVVSSSNLGFKHSAEFKAARSASGKGRVHDAEARARISAATKGKPRSEAQKAALLRNQALAHTPEAVAKRLVSMRSLYDDPEYLAALSERQRVRMAEHPPTQEWREKVSAGTKAGIAAAGRRLLAETGWEVV